MRTSDLAILAAVLWANFNMAMPACAQSASKPNTIDTKTRAIDVDSRPLASFHKDGADSAKIGKLKWRGGLALSSGDPLFGGYSGLEVSSDGRRFIAVSDAGSWLAGQIVYERGRLAGVTNTQAGALKGLGNKTLQHSRDRDAEAVRLMAGNLTSGTVLISFEINQRIGFFPIRAGQIAGPTHYLRPGHRMAANKGLETVAVVGHGSKRNVIAFAERLLDPNGDRRGFLWQGNRATPSPVALVDLQDFDITDAVGLPDGRLIVLERRFRWSEGVKMRIREIAANRVRAGAVMNGRTLLSADLRYEIDNMEGISAHVDGQGKTILTLISDNNFNNLLQRTLMLQFEFAE